MNSETTIFLLAFLLVGEADETFTTDRKFSCVDHGGVRSRRVLCSGASASGAVLDEAAYRKLLTQTQNLKPYTYRAVGHELFEDIVSQKLPPGEGPPTGPITTAVSAQQEN